MGNDNSFFVVGMITAGAMFIFGQVLYHIDSHKKRDRPDLVAKTIQYADVNVDSRISHEEWAEVYKIVGKKYNDASSNPLDDRGLFKYPDLTYSDLKKYVGHMRNNGN